MNPIDTLISKLPDFEQFLMDKHGEDYIGIDDNMPDAYEEWKQDLSPEDWLEYGKEYRNACTQALKKCKFGLSITPQQLHDLYLEAITSGVAGEQYNPNAVKPYEKLTPEQQAIDKYIATALNKHAETLITIEER